MRKRDSLTAAELAALADDHDVPEVWVDFNTKFPVFDGEVILSEAIDAQKDARIAELEAKVARVEALADEWDQGGTIWQMFAGNLRAALTGASDD